MKASVALLGAVLAAGLGPQAATIARLQAEPERSPEPSIQSQTLRQIAVLENDLRQSAFLLETATSEPIPSGMILMWAGSAKNIPAGWVLCDGANRTPDLRNRFILGTAGAGDVGATGGSPAHAHLAANHQHPVPAFGHAHTVPTVEDIRTEPSGEHTHEVGIAIGSAIHVDQFGFGGEQVAAEAHTHTLFVSRPRWHRHVLRIAGTGTIGTLSTNETSFNDSPVTSAGHLPPYYSLCYIMKQPGASTASPMAPPGASLSERLLALAHAAATLSARLDSSVPSLVPAGLVVLWAGVTETVPDSWLECDGAPGAPDLRNRFVLGAFDSRDAGETGGSSTHLHTASAHSHRVVLPLHHHAIPSVSTTTATVPGHAHTMEPASPGKGSERGGDRYDAASLAGHTHVMSVAGAHAHAIVLPATATSSNKAEGWTGLAESSLRSSTHLPPYTKLRYLVKGKTRSGVVALESLPTGTDAESRLGALEKTAAQLAQFADLARSDSLPIGVIAVWPGTLETVPPGWIPCDGESGTPDLRGRFVLGAKDVAGLTGGSAQHDHTLGSHSHTVYFPHAHNRPARVLRTLTVVDSEHLFEFETAHTHVFAQFCESVADLTIGGDILLANELHNHDLGGRTAHEHDVTVDQPLVPAGRSLSSTSAEATYDADTASHMPRFRKMIFVMKAKEPPDDEPQWVQCETITISAGKVRLTWLSQAGHSYAIEHTSALVTAPFTSIAGNLPATPPVNVFEEDLRPSMSFYRIRERPVSR